MILDLSAYPIDKKGVPRGSGDDPGLVRCGGSCLRVFPAGAGMILGHKGRSGKGQSVPRGSGDDPKRLLRRSVRSVCSPRERG